MLFRKVLFEWRPVDMETLEWALEDGDLEDLQESVEWVTDQVLR